MLLNIIEFIAHGLPFYRAYQDAGGWITDSDKNEMQHYLEMWLVNKGLLD